MNAYDIEIEYDQENDNYYAEHEFAYPSKRVRLNIDTDNSLWPTDESNSMTITIPSNPQTDTNNTWDDTTKTLTLTNLDQNTLITNNQNPTFNYATDLNINLSNYQPSSNTFNNSISKIKASGDQTIIIADNNTNNNWTFYRSQTTVNVSNNSEIVYINKPTYENRYVIYIYCNYSYSSYTVSPNSWFYSKEIGGQYSPFVISFLNNDNLEIVGSSDSKTNDTNTSTVTINADLINFDGISWMTFN